MKVLFVCEGNVNRSQMAEAMLKAMMPEVEAASAGTMVKPRREGQLVSGETSEGIQSMSEIGFDMSGAMQNRLTSQMAEAADKVILVGPTPGGPLPEFLRRSPKLEVWNVPDPGYGHVTVAEARDLVLERVKSLVEALRTAK